MKTTRLSLNGKVTIPKDTLATFHWNPGLELQVIELGDGILLRPKKPFAESTLEEVAGCLKYQGKPKTQKDIEIAMKQSALRERRRRD